MGLNVDVEAFERDGAVCVRGLASAAEIAELAAAIDEHLRHPSPLAVVASSPNDPGRFLEDFCNWERIPAYEHFFRTSAAAATGGRLTGSASIRLYHDHLLVKEAGTCQPTPWHQDQPYYNVSGSQLVSLWLPVDPVGRDATLEFAVGSHRGPWLMPRTFRDREARWFPEGALADIPAEPSPVIGWALEPGDGVFFHALTLHRSAGSPTRRRVLSFRFLGDDCRHVVRPWRTSPPFPGLTDDLPDGAPFHHPLFPVLWNRT